MAIVTRNLVHYIQRYIRRFNNESCSARTLKRAAKLERKWIEPDGVVDRALKRYPLSGTSLANKRVFKRYLLRYVKGSTQDFKILFDEQNE